MKLAKVSTSHIQAVTGTTFVSTLSSLLFGYCTAVISGVVGAIEHNFIEPRHMHETAAHALLGLTVCAALGGTILGALSARRTAELLGRKRPMIIASVLFLVSAFGSAFPETGLAPLGGLGPDAIWPFIFYRILGGMAVGLASVVAPMYVAEFAPSAVRGQLGAYQQIAIAGGVAIVLFVNWGIALQGDDDWVMSVGWRYMMVSLAIPALAFFWLSFSVPESPSWLVKHGRVEEARRALSRSADPEEVRAALADLAQENHVQDPPVPLFAFGTRVVLVGVSLSLLQQLLGLNAISYYGPQILQRMGFHMDAAFLGVLIARSLNLLATMIVVIIVDRVGRKPLLIFGALTMGLSMLAIGSLFQAGNTGALGLVAMCCYMIGLGMSFGPIVWILMSEIFPGPIRGEAMSLAIAAQWGANFLVSFTFPVMFGDSVLDEFAHGGFAFWIYGGFGVLAAFVVLRFVPETKGIDNERLGVFWRRQAGLALEPGKA
ncbi:MAG TPA: sugar porter family MFS transporter [Steroidobacteraceae bacterium]|jgi:SP family xylose:H+ symportor-like MFS transporter|nr:sugar porter family MFS transporter [Steroidobacteraceae bacterium]